jgi:magnesium-transporting ATPase (P-type)
MKAEQNIPNPPDQNASERPQKNTSSTSLFVVFVALFFPTVQTIFIILEAIHLIEKSNTIDEEMTIQNLIIISLLTLYIWMLAVCTCYVTRLSILKFARNTIVGLALVLIGYCLLGIIIESIYAIFLFDVQFIPLIFMFLFYYLLISTRIKNIIGWEVKS